MRSTDSNRASVKSFRLNSESVSFFRARKKLAGFLGVLLLIPYFPESLALENYSDVGSTHSKSLKWKSPTRASAAADRSLKNSNNKDALTKNPLEQKIDFNEARSRLRKTGPSSKTQSAKNLSTDEAKTEEEATAKSGGIKTKSAATEKTEEEPLVKQKNATFLAEKLKARGQRTRAGGDSEDEDNEGTAKSSKAASNARASTESKSAASAKTDDDTGSGEKSEKPVTLKFDSERLKAIRAAAGQKQSNSDFLADQLKARGQRIRAGGDPDEDDESTSKSSGASSTTGSKGAAAAKADADTGSGSKGEKPVVLKLNQDRLKAIRAAAGLKEPSPEEDDVPPSKKQSAPQATAAKAEEKTEALSTPPLATDQFLAAQLKARNQRTRAGADPDEDAEDSADRAKPAAQAATAEKPPVSKPRSMPLTSLSRYRRIETSGQNGRFYPNGYTAPRQPVDD